MASLPLKELEDLTDNATAGYLLFVFDSLFFAVFPFGVYLLTLIWSWISSGMSSPPTPNTNLDIPSENGPDIATVLFYGTVAAYFVLLRRLQDGIYYAVKVVASEPDLPIRQLVRKLNQVMLRKWFEPSLSLLTDLVRALYLVFVWYFMQQCFLTNYATPWYTTTMQWPSIVREVACEITSIADTILRKFFEWTNDPAVIGALTDAWGAYFTIEKWRLKIRQYYAGGAWSTALEGCNGAVHTYIFRLDPLAQTAVLVATVTAALLCFSFYRVTRKLFDTIYFWLIALAAILVAALASHLLYDVLIGVVYLTVPDTTWTRVYTEVGYASIYAGVGAGVCALLGMLLPGFESLDAYGANRRVNLFQLKQQRADAQIVEAKQAAERADGVLEQVDQLAKVVSTEVKKEVRVLSHYTKAVIAFVFSETFVFVLISLFLLLYISQSRFPVQSVRFSSLNITVFPDYMNPEYNEFESYWENYHFSSMQQLQIDIVDYIINANKAMLYELEGYIPSIPGFTIPNVCLGFLDEIIQGLESAFDFAKQAYQDVLVGLDEVQQDAELSVSLLTDAIANQAAFAHDLQQLFAQSTHAYNYMAGFACSSSDTIVSNIDSRLAGPFNNLCNEFLAFQPFIKAASILAYGGEDAFNAVVQEGGSLVFGAADAIVGAEGNAIGWISGAYGSSSNWIAGAFKTFLGLFEFNRTQHHQTHIHLQRRKTRTRTLQERIHSHNAKFQEYHRKVFKHIATLKHKISHQHHKVSSSSSSSRFHTQSLDNCPYSIASLLQAVDIPFPDDGLAIPSIDVGYLLKQLTSDVDSLLKTIVHLTIPALNTVIKAFLQAIGTALEDLEEALQPVVKLAIRGVMDLYQVFSGLHLDLSWIPPYAYYLPLLLLLGMIASGLLGFSARLQRAAAALKASALLYLVTGVLSFVFAVLTARTVLESVGYTFVINWRTDVYVWLAAAVYTPLSFCLVVLYETDADSIDPELLVLRETLRRRQARNNKTEANAENNKQDQEKKREASAVELQPLIQRSLAGRFQNANEINED